MLARCTACLVLCLGPFSGAAQSADSRERAGFWGGMDVGIGVVERSYSQTSSTTDTKFAFAISGGYAWNPKLLLGVEFGGWTLQSSNLWDSEKGQAIETLFAVARYYPTRDSPLFIRAGGGRVKYWTNQPGESGANGWGGAIGVGYDVYASNHVRLAPSIEYSFGSFNGATSPPGITQDQRFQAITLTFGITLH